MAAEKEETQFLKAYDRRQFLSPLTTVDMAIFAIVDGELNVLVVKRSQHPAKGRLALPGGFVDESKDATLLESAHRKLVEKTGVTAPYLEQVGTVGSAARDPRGWSLTVLYFSLIDHAAVAAPTRGVNEPSEESKWLTATDALRAELAFDHHDLLESAIDRLRSRTRYTALPLALMPPTFTLTELQGVYEAILGVTLEKKSFRRRLLDAGVIADSGEVQRGTHRPAVQYRRTEVQPDFQFPRSLALNET